MSVTFNSKSGMITGDGWELMDSKSEHGGGFRKSARCIGGVALCLGLLYLLLLVIIIAMLDALKNEKDTLQIERDGLRTERDNLTVERDQLSLVSSNLTKELEELQIRFSKVAASRDGLKEEAQELNQNRSVKLCPTKWVKFKEKCYYISEKDETKSWRSSRRDCQDRGGDLVIVTSKAEEDFISEYHDRVWIGLSDLERDGKWKWVNGNELDFEGFWQNGEPNDDRNAEDCVEHSHSGRGWNDMPCREKLSWICED
uniref:Low affinity immunoglobulin epsilon Fc receptor-like n=1 Tax=Hippocampus comes TaxID=109280 RepID=A0A3Q3DCR6_HIPCM